MDKNKQHMPELISVAQNPEKLAQFERFLGFLNLDPNNISLRLKVIELGIECQVWDLLKQVIRDGLNLDPNNISFRGHAGMLALRDKEYSLACNHFEFVVASDDAPSPSILYNYAFSLFYLAEYERAYSILEQIAPSSEMQKVVNVLSARCLHHVGRPDEAIELIKQLSVAEMDAETQGVLALLLHETERTTEASETANRALSLNPQQLDALLARASLEAELDRYDNARRDYIVATTAHPSCGRAWSGLAQLDMRDMQFDKAQEGLEQAVKLMPDHIGTWHMLAWIHILHGRAEEAKYAFDRSYEIDRNFGETHGGFAVVAAMQQQRKLSEQYMRRARKLNPDGVSVHYAELLLLKAEGKHDEAKVVYDTVMSSVKLPSGLLMGVAVEQRLAEMSTKSDSVIH
jgi:tetratricopeptide (TPR) repeat protein